MVPGFSPIHKVELFGAVTVIMQVVGGGSLGSVGSEFPVGSVDFPPQVKIKGTEIIIKVLSRFFIMGFPFSFFSHLIIKKSHKYMKLD
jgi:hypothetical protein